MDLIRDHEDERHPGLLQRLFDLRGVEKPDRDVDGLAVPAPPVDMNFAGVHDRSQPYPQRRLRGLRVVLGEQGCQQRYKAVEQNRLGHIVMWPD
jgi:hypothetical protein